LLFIRRRQGQDVGPYFRSVIFYHTPERGKQARQSKEALEISGELGLSKVVAQIVPAGKFWRAEEEHQRHYERHEGGHCGRCIRGF